MKRNIFTPACAFAIGCFVAVHSACAQSLTFAPTTYVSGVNIGDLNSTCLVAVDINGDGKPDLISVNDGSSTLTVLTNNGSGGFGSNAPVNVGSAVVWAVAADVNGDNKPDLICANGGNPGTLIVMTNNGGGIFSSNATLAVGFGPTCIAAADVNGDHKIDLISANTFGDTLTVYTNNGSGGFGFSATLNAGVEPSYVIAADLTGSGKMDLICADQFADTIMVLTNNGSGVFGSNATYNAGSEPISMVAADFQGNGKPDLVIADYGFSSGTMLLVLTNNGFGAFGSNTTLVVGEGPESVIATDINGDGKPDLISANSQDNTLTVLTNNGAGGFGTNTTLWEGENPDCVVAADVNGDGRMDLIGGDRFTGLTLQTQVGFTAYRYAVGNQPYSVVAVDVTNENKLALITANSATSTLTMFTNNGSGIFGSNTTFHVGSGPIFLATADINGDNRQDLICVNNGATTLSILTNNANGGFGSNATLVVGTSPTCVAPVDVNSNGKVGLAVTVSGELLLFTNNGSGVFGSGAVLAVNNDPEFVVAADVNGDHRPDLICANGLNSKQNDANGTLLVLTNNGSGGFGSNNLYEVGQDPRSVLAVDVNGDGQLDLISANYTSSTLTVLTNNGSGIFSSNATYNVGINPISVVAADINGDGSPDLITANFSANSDVSTLTMLTNNGSGIFGPYATITVDTQFDINSTPTYITAADVNNDGKPDLMITTRAGTLTMLINTIAFPTPPTPLMLGTTFSSANGLVLFWSSASTNIVVQTNASLTGASWGTAGYAISTANGTNHSVTIMPAPGNLFFRLKQ
jgi:FG-GAP-like repeat